jgi:hypothetical protein
LAGDEAQLFKWRCIELKHGRVAMLAVVGLIVAEAAPLPGALFWEGWYLEEIERRPR